MVLWYEFMVTLLLVKNTQFCSNIFYQQPVYNTFSLWVLAASFISHTFLIPQYKYRCHFSHFNLVSFIGNWFRLGGNFLSVTGKHMMVVCVSLSQSHKSLSLSVLELPSVPQCWYMLTVWSRLAQVVEQNVWITKISSTDMKYSTEN